MCFWSFLETQAVLVACWNDLLGRESSLLVLYTTSVYGRDFVAQVRKGPGNGASVLLVSGSALIRGLWVKRAFAYISCLRGVGGVTTYRVAVHTPRTRMVHVCPA